MEKDLQLFIMPSFDSTRESLGYDMFDDYDADAILFQQGYDGSQFDVADNEIFEVPRRFIGRINCEGDYYLIDYKDSLKRKENFRIEDDLRPGRYKFMAKDRVIFVLKEYDDELEEIESVENNMEELIYNLITDSAKKRFNYSELAENLEDDFADHLLYEMIVALAMGESKETIAAKLNSQIILRGFIIEDFTPYIEDREKDLGMEILALRIAITNLKDGADPAAVYLKTENFLSNIKTKG